MSLVANLIFVYKLAYELYYELLNFATKFQSSKHSSKITNTEKIIAVKSYLKSTVILSYTTFIIETSLNIHVCHLNKPSWPRFYGWNCEEFLNINKAKKAIDKEY
jgi:hypothetical protein